MIQGIRHIGLVVHDLDASLYFWIDIMGFQTQRRMQEKGEHLDAMLGLSGVEVTTVKLVSANNVVLELLHFKSHPDKPVWQGKPFSTGLTHIALTVDNIEHSLNRLKLFNSDIRAAPQMSPDHSVKAVYTVGPEGLLLELVEVLKQ